MCTKGNSQDKMGQEKREASEKMSVEGEMQKVYSIIEIEGWKRKLVYDVD